MTGLIVVGSGLVLGAAPAQAANAADFDPGYIISDAKFFDAGSMSASAIQSFLIAKGANCTGGTVPCLKNYTESTTSREASTRCSAYSGAANEAASTIIAKVAKACGVNPQVLLVTLQKENSLVTSSGPSAGAYRTAMGYGCPDTAACDSLYFGFFNQVYSAASQFIRYGVTPSNWRYHIGQIAVQYHPNADCGAPVVNIRNQATANLYNYTPYQPNAAAMANLGTVGDACSSYGNRNFWAYFTDWFGSTTEPIDPYGYLDSVTAVEGGVRVTGWVIDPNTASPILAKVSVNGTRTNISANKPRPDVAAAYPGTGKSHGFDAVLPASTLGAQEVCVSGVNVGEGVTTSVGCLSVTVTRVTSGASIKLGTAAIKLNATSKVTVTITVPGVAQPTGIITAYTGNRALGTYTLNAASSGVQVITLPAFTTTGGKSITIRYGGTSKIAGSTSTAKVLSVFK